MLQIIGFIGVTFLMIKICEIMALNDHRDMDGTLTVPAALAILIAGAAIAIFSYLLVMTRPAF
jgi:hypothetical protein